jgi:hypothetical protein
LLLNLRQKNLYLIQGNKQPPDPRKVFKEFIANRGLSEPAGYSLHNPTCGRSPLEQQGHDQDARAKKAANISSTTACLEKLTPRGLLGRAADRQAKS